MKSGYMALFGLVLAYSAYQGMSLPSTPPKNPATGSQTISKPVKTAPQPLGENAKVEAFPTIGGGLCRLALDGGAQRPCGACAALCPAEGLQSLIGDYFRTEQWDRGASDDLAAHWNVPQSARRHIKFVVASLPDPVHTHMGLLFDRFTEAIEQAAQASNYLFSRAWMPWQVSTHSESTDFTVRLAEAKLRDATEALPGLMVFQKPSEEGQAPSMLFVFVIGETPTGGLRVEQFQNALNIRRAILAGLATDAEDGNILRILGPTFSGSLRTLNAILYAEPNRGQFKQIVIRSGTVSSYRAVCEFEKALLAEWPDPPGSVEGTIVNDGRPQLVSFQFSDEYEESYLRRFFLSRHTFHSHVAILSEGQTVFGSQEQGVSRKADGCTTDEPKDDFQFLRLYFPREIAQLRDAYQRDVKTVQGAGATGTPQAAPGLPLSLSVTGNDDDSVASYSPLQTPLSQESILQSIVVSLRRVHAKVVVVRATDPLDVVFLCRYLRQNYPQARLVTIGIDLLMIHDLYDPRFHGILGVAAYPLLNGIEFPGLAENSAHRVHRLFPDSYSVGEFNALASLLIDEKQNGKLPPADYVQFGLPGFLKDSTEWKAHLWLTAIGREGFWPVTILDDVGPDPAPDKQLPGLDIPAVAGQSKLQTPFTVHFPFDWTIFWSLALLLTLFMAVLLAYPHTFTRSEILARFALHPSKQRNRLLFAAAMLLVAVQTLFFLPMIVWLKPYGLIWRGWEDIFTGMCFSTVCYAASVVLLGFACKRGFENRGQLALARAGKWISIGIVIVMLAVTAFTCPVNSWPRLGSFLYRYVDIGSGVSPCLPLLFTLLAWMWWCWQSLTGIVSVEEKSIALPPAGYIESKTEGGGSGQVDVDPCAKVRLKLITDQACNALWKVLEVLPLGRSRKIGKSALVAFGIIVLWMRPDEIAEAFESRPYKWMYWILLYSCLLLLCYLVMHILDLWLEFRGLLQAIDRLPFRRGFQDLKGLTWKPLWKLAGAGRQDFQQLLGEELDALTRIKNAGISEKGLVKGIEESQRVEKELCTNYEKVLAGQKNEQTIETIRADFQRLQKGLAETAAYALLFANDQWKTEPSSPLREPRAETNDKEKPDAPIVASDPKTRAVEHFLCSFYMNVILVPLRRLQTLILAMAGVFVFVLLSYSSYPFESRESFHGLLIGIFFAMSLAVGIVYGQMYANPLLSMITHTVPGQLGFDFWVKLGSFVFVPLVSLISVQFPELNSYLFSWLQPALQSLK